MLLKEALSKFEHERKTPHDYYCVGFKDPYGNYHSLPSMQYSKLLDADVVGYEHFKGSTSDFSLDSLKFGKTHECDAVEILIDYDEVTIRFPFHRCVTRKTKSHSRKKFSWRNR